MVERGCRLILINKDNTIGLIITREKTLDEKIKELPDESVRYLMTEEYVLANKL